MGSILRIPNPYPWQGSTYGDKRLYLMVMRMENSEAVCLVESPVVTDDNINVLSQVFKKKWHELSEKYSHPEYDLISITVSGIEELKGMFAPKDDFKGVEIERISV